MTFRIHSFVSLGKGTDTCSVFAIQTAWVPVRSIPDAVWCWSFQLTIFHSIQFHPNPFVVMVTMIVMQVMMMSGSGWILFVHPFVCPFERQFSFCSLSESLKVKNAEARVSHKKKLWTFIKNVSQFKVEIFILIVIQILFNVL